MFKRIVLLLCIAFVVICYGFPFFVLPFGEYKYSETIADATVNYSITFGFDGKGVATVNSGEITIITREFTYKVSNRAITVTYSDELGGEDTYSLSSIYQVSVQGRMCENMIGMWTAVGVGALAVITVLLPNKRR